MIQLNRTVGRAMAGVALALLLLANPAEGRTLKSRLQEDANSPSDQVRPLQRGAVQKSPLQHSVAQKAIVQKSIVQKTIVQKGAVQKGDVCCHSISYRHHCSLRKTCCCSCATIKTVLTVDDPCCCGNSIAVPVCLPDCCDDCPRVVRDGGHLGRGVTTFVWCCGYKVKVVVDRCGDVVVHSYGR